MNKKTILHISSDFPDIYNNNKTKAVFNLINNTAEYNHKVISLTKSKNFSYQKKNNIISIKYKRYPYGFFLYKNLKFLSEIIKKIISTEKFDIIHSHKLTIEAIIGDILAQQFNKKHIISIRGDTDITITRLKPHYYYIYKRIIKNSNHIFFLAPWTHEFFQNKFNIGSNFSFLPNITFHEETPKKLEPSNKFVTTISLKSKNYKNKNFKKLIESIYIIKKNFKYNNIILDVYTTTEDPKIFKYLEIINKLNLQSNIQFKKITNNKRFVCNLKNYIAFIRPSFPETFGMVFVESLLSGLPILHAKNTAIDGYLENFEFIKKVNHLSSKEISQSIYELYQNQTDYKKKLFYEIEKETFKKFKIQNIVKHYEKEIGKQLP